MGNTKNEEQARESPKKRSDRTYDPNAISVWPVYPSGTRLPMANWSRRKQLAILVLVLTMMAGWGAILWWLIDTVRNR